MPAVDIGKGGLCRSGVACRGLTLTPGRRPSASGGQFHSPNVGRIFFQANQRAFVFNDRGGEADSVCDRPTPVAGFVRALAGFIGGRLIAR